MRRQWPGKSGRWSRKASEIASSKTTRALPGLAIIWQKAQGLGESAAGVGLSSMRAAYRVSALGRARTRRRTTPSTRLHALAGALAWIQLLRSGPRPAMSPHAQGSDCTRRPGAGLCSLTALEVVLGRLRASRCESNRVEFAWREVCEEDPCRKRAPVIPNQPRGFRG